jgi:integrase
MDEIKVYVIERKGRPFLYMRYSDPVSGKQESKSTGTRSRREAERAAAKWEAELRDGRYSRATRIRWDDFRDRYTQEKLMTLADATVTSVCATLNYVEQLVGPKRLADLTPETLSRFQSRLRKVRYRNKPLRETSIACHLRQLRAALSWGVGQGMLNQVPRIEKPKRARGITRNMRGRPITAEEFDRMILAAPEVRKRETDKWIRLLRGLWLSGLRLGEALALSWDEDADLTIRLGGKYPKLRIFAEGEKGHKDRLLPLTPDFAELLYAIPAEDRHGLVFGITTSKKRAGRCISDIGRHARVVVNKSEGKFASAHDLRRSFGTRWAMRVKPATLQALMRHQTIETTLKYYVEMDADDIAAELWGSQNSGDHLGDQGDFRHSEDSRKSS